MCLNATKKNPPQVRFVMYLGALWCVYVRVFSLISLAFSLAKMSYLAKVDESLDLVTELETSEFHDQFHQQSALRAQSQN